MHTSTHNMPHNIVVGCGKGGVAKTTTAVSLACYLAAQGFRTLLIDGDPQGDSSDALGLAPEPGLSAWVGSALLAAPSSVAPHLRQCWCNQSNFLSLWILPGASQTARLENTLSSNSVPVDFLQRLTADDQHIQSTFDCIVWDTPASGRLMEMIVHLADLIVAPVRPGQLDVRGLGNFLTKARSLTSARIAILPTMFRRTDTICPANVDNIAQAWPDNVIRVGAPDHNEACIHNGILVVPERVAVRRSQGMGVSIFAHAPTDAAAQSYATLGEFVTGYLSGQPTTLTIFDWADSARQGTAQGSAQ